MAGEETTNQQSNINVNYNAAQTGLDMDHTLGQVPKGKLTYALNANIENFDSNSVNYQNEEGNELCLTFPEGYQVIGKHYIQEKFKHIFFLVNPTTGGSEIGYMVNNDCVYHSLLNNSCLNFNVNYPIHKCVHRITNCTTEIYWTDGLNERRFLDIDSVPTGDVCNKLKIQPNFNIPQLDVKEVLNGGDLKAGTYQFAIQYCDAQGFGYTSYYSITNPLSIANIDIATPNFDYPVNKSIVLDIANLETAGYFTYFNLAVVKTINSITSVELIGTYYINQSTDEIVYSGQSKTDIRLTVNDIFEKFPYYDIAQDVTSVQDVLVWDQLTSNARVNYQKIAADITLNWETYQMPLNKNYSDPLNTAMLRGYLRDEVYAFEICFLLKNGQQTDSFHIPGRTAVTSDLITISKASNDDYIGPGTSAPTWKIYNTASVTGAATGDPINGATPYQYGKFAYWESTEEYPSNPTSVFAQAGLTGPIRHHKFPDSVISPPFQSYTPEQDLSGVYQLSIHQSNVVYPIGVRVDTQQVWDLIQASSLTAEEKAEITGFKILRANRSGNASIVGKGILRNVGKYTRDQTSYYFANYPYNDLRQDPFLLENNNAYSSSSTYWTINVTVAGSLQYTDLYTGEVKSKDVSIGSTSLCSPTKPAMLTGTATINSPVSQYGGQAFQLTSNSSTVIRYQNPINYPTNTNVTVVAGQPVNIMSVSTPIYISGDSRFTVIQTDTINPLCYPNNLSAFSTDESKFRQIFNSPETSFGQPSLGNVLKLEQTYFGAANSHFVTVNNNAKYALLTGYIQKQALKSSYDLASSTGTFDANAMFTTYQAYLQIYINSAPKKNFAYSFNSIASFDYSQSIPNDGNKQRELDIYQYLVSGVQSTGDTYNINNYSRETSIYLKTAGTTTALPYPDTTISTYSITDGTRFSLSQIQNCGNPEKVVKSNSVVYYASLKNIIYNQYGQMYSYETIDTGFQFDFDSAKTVKTVFGGDTYISKFAFKTKLPFFIDNRVGAPDGSDVEYDQLGNIAYPQYWHSSRSLLYNYWAGDKELQNIISVKALSFDCISGTVINPLGLTTTTTTAAPGTVTRNVNDPSYTGKFYLFAYGIPYFYCESSINLDLRQATNNNDGDFYPHVSTGIPDEWLQQTKVPIALDNTYNYNITYSKQNTENFFSHLPFDWDGSQCRTVYPFRAIYSDPQVSSPTSKVNNWLIYRPVSYFDFPQSYGSLVSLDGIQNKAVIARFENKSLLYNTLLTIDTSNPQAAYVGNSTLFRSAPPVDYAETDLGYVGSQHKMLLKIPQGQVSIDAKRGQIFLLSGNGATDLTGFGSGVNRFMTDHMAFEILRYYPNVYIDNAYNGIGLCGVYDSKYDRVIITKLDYIPQPNYVGLISYNSEDQKFYYGETEVQLTDLTYFCNRSWTLSFNMNTRSWVSFHTYLPNYYIGDNNFYYSGKIGIGMWRHLTNTLLNNNYYGTIQPYVIEYPFMYQYHDEILQNVKDYTRAYQYLPIPDGVYNDNAKIQTDNYYFNKAVLYNGQQSTGLLELVKKPAHSLAAYNQYPIYNAESKTITFTKSDSFYQYNTFWNVVKDKLEPLFNITCESLSIDKAINQANMDYGTRSFRKDPLRAKGLLIRHILDNRSDIHMVSQFIVAPSQISYK